MAMTYHVVVPFGLDEQGHPIPLEPIEAPHADSARRRAERFAETNAGAVAFSRTGYLRSFNDRGQYGTASE